MLKQYKITAMALACALAIIPAFQASAQGKLLLSWGAKDSQLGLYKDGDYLRGPSFFALDEKGSIYVADAYKERVAIFDAAGTYLRAVAIPAVSPRTSFFARTADGSFVIGNDMELSRWSTSGERLGGASIGLDTPKAVYASSGMAAIWPSASEADACRCFDRSLGTERLLSLRRGDRQVAAFRDEGGRYWLPDYAEQRALYRWSAELPASAALIDWKSNGESLWRAEEGNASAYYRLDPSGVIVAKNALPHQAGARDRRVIAISPALGIFYGMCTIEGFEIGELR
jgi:hypothetical protein